MIWIQFIAIYSYILKIAYLTIFDFHTKVSRSALVALNHYFISWQKFNYPLQRILKWNWRTWETVKCRENSLQFTNYSHENYWAFWIWYNLLQTHEGKRFRDNPCEFFVMTIFCNSAIVTFKNFQQTILQLNAVYKYYIMNSRLKIGNIASISIISYKCRWVY